MTLRVTSALVFLVLLTESLRADTFTYLDSDSKEQVVEAQLLGSGQGRHALLKADGQILMVPQEAVQKREPAEAPPAATPEELVAVLEERFGAERLQTHYQAPFLVALVLAGPLEGRSTTRVTGFLRKTARFMDSVETVFSRFARDMKFPLRDPEFPLVTIVFESDDDFNTFAVETTGGAGPSADNLAGFYNGLTNWLAIRLVECRTYQVPLHEAIHQQMYNRVLQRAAPVPRWFDEGIATGFENNGERVDVHPAKINSTYAWLAKDLPSDGVSFHQIVTDDQSFHGDIMAAQSYVQAWSLHWMLVTGHTDSYQTYVQDLASREPLQELTGEERADRFQEAFGASIREIAADFPRALESGMRRQRIKPPAQPPVGVSLTNDALAEVKLKAANGLDGRMRVEGTVKNDSPIRPLTYHVAVITNTGVYTDWVIPNVPVGKTAPLELKTAAKVMPGAFGGISSTFMVRVQWTLPDSDEARDWIRRAPLPAGFEALE